jgi:hypothetical protein
MNTVQDVFRNFLNDQKEYPVLAAVAAGLYPTLFYFSTNYGLINSWGHVGFFVLFFLFIPMVVFFLFHKLTQYSKFKKLQKYVLPFLNVFVFLFLLKICLYADLEIYISTGIVVFSALFAFVFYRQLKKIITIQLILAVIGIFTVIPEITKQLNYSEDWMIQPDGIEQVIFKKKPNIYFIQPDGYVNFLELKKGKYNFDPSDFENYLVSQGFKNYPSFRSNYASTLTSNSATFMMKHHYYNNLYSASEAVNARDIIISDNSVLKIFRNNGYKTHFLAELPYLLLNRAKLGYDTCNFDYGDLGYIGTGLEERQDFLTPLGNVIDDYTASPNFFFIEIFNPGHIQTSDSDSSGIEGERALWLKGLHTANLVMEKTIDIIKSKDPNALIVVMADHGGYVGFNHTKEAYSKTADEDAIRSIFSSNLSILWPNYDAPEIDKNFKSSVNLFRVLFSWLGEDDKYLNHLQEDESYMKIKSGAPEGIYKYINENDEITFEKYISD